MEKSTIVMYCSLTGLELQVSGIKTSGYRKKMGAPGLSLLSRATFNQTQHFHPRKSLEKVSGLWPPRRKFPGITQLFRTANFIGPGYRAALLFSGWVAALFLLFVYRYSQPILQGVLESCVVAQNGEVLGLQPPPEK